MKNIRLCVLTVGLFFACIFASMEDEPRCSSRFDYEYKVIHKLVELERKQLEQQKAMETLIQNCAVCKTQRQEVAFSAFLTKELRGVQDYQVLVFGYAHINIGHAYNDNTGVFTCKIPGIYVFHLVITTKDYQYLNADFIVNGVEKVQAFADAGNQNDYAVASNSIITELKFGDQVWIRSGTWHNGSLHGDRRSSLSGFLLYSR